MHTYDTLIYSTVIYQDRPADLSKTAVLHRVCRHNWARRSSRGRDADMYSSLNYFSCAHMRPILCVRRRHTYGRTTPGESRLQIVRTACITKSAHINRLGTCDSQCDSWIPFDANKVRVSHIVFRSLLVSPSKGIEATYCAPWIANVDLIWSPA